MSENPHAVQNFLHRPSEVKGACGFQEMECSSGSHIPSLCEHSDSNGPVYVQLEMDLSIKPHTVQNFLHLAEDGLIASISFN